MFAEMLGETEITYYTKGSSNSSSKGGGSSGRSRTEHRTKKHLFEPAQFTRLKTGRCVVINPNFVCGEEAYLPILKSIEIRQEEIAHQQWSVANWDTLLEHIISSRPKTPEDFGDRESRLHQMLLDREDLSKVILPAVAAA